MIHLKQSRSMAREAMAFPSIHLNSTRQNPHTSHARISWPDMFATKIPGSVNNAHGHVLQSSHCQKQRSFQSPASSWRQHWQRLGHEQQDCWVSRADCLTIRSSRDRFAARLSAVMCTTPPCRAAVRLNSGVRWHEPNSTAID